MIRLLNDFRAIHREDNVDKDRKLNVNIPCYYGCHDMQCLFIQSPMEIKRFCHMIKDGYVTGGLIKKMKKFKILS